jgi:hypothetical protein
MLFAASSTGLLEGALWSVLTVPAVAQCGLREDEARRDYPMSVLRSARNVS